MTTCRLLVLVLCTALAIAPAVAGPSQVEAMLAQHQKNGFSSPLVAVKQLTDAAQGMEAAALPLRMRYHASLASLYVMAEQQADLERELAILQGMADSERCVPCGTYKLVRETHFSIRKQDNQKVKAQLARLEAIETADPELMQAVHYMRASAYESLGNHSRAIDESIKSAKLATQTGNLAEQVRTLNLLMLSNIGRRDLKRAEALAQEAYALAERMGYTYMMAYVRANQAWIYALTKEPEKQLRVLNEALAMTRAHPGLADAELVNLANLAEHHVGRKNYQLALDLANEAAALADRQKKITTKGVILTTLAMAQAGLGEPDKGIATMQQAVALLRTSGAHNYLIDALEQQAAIYENSGRHREALAALREFNKEQKEATRKERDKVLAEAQEKFSAERKDLEIERLSLESGRRKAEVDARDWRQRLWATVAVALALGTALLVQMVSRARRRNRLLEDSNAVLSDQSVHDPLTGAFNRRHCVSLMDQHQATLAARPRERLSSAGVGLMLIDVDHFKHINDTHGHAAGDEVLVEIARRLQDLVRQHDVVVRWGGEEFVLVLQRTPTEGLAVLAERVLKVVGQAPVLVGGQAIPVSISAGCASYPMMAGQPWQDCLKVADAAMYLSKQQGRNRAICVMAMREGLTSEALVADLARARDAGDITLQVVRGPVQQARDAEAMGI